MRQLSSTILLLLLRALLMLLALVVLALALVLLLQLVLLSSSVVFAVFLSYSAIPNRGPHAMARSLFSILHRAMIFHMGSLSFTTCDAGFSARAGVGGIGFVRSFRISEPRGPS